MKFYSNFKLKLNFFQNGDATLFLLDVAKAMHKRVASLFKSLLSLLQKNNTSKTCGFFYKKSCGALQDSI